MNYRPGIIDWPNVAHAMGRAIRALVLLALAVGIFAVIGAAIGRAVILEFST